VGPAIAAIRKAVPIRITPSARQAGPRRLDNVHPRGFVHVAVGGGSPPRYPACSVH
jgi:hypothetical protein